MLSKNWMSHSSFHRRPGVTAAQLRERRIELIETLNSARHIEYTITRDYGKHDPRIAPFPACTCSAPANLSKRFDGKWSVACTRCSKKTRDPQKYDWAACIQWCVLNLSELDYRDQPLFGLARLDREDARIRMISIYDDLLLRSQIGTLDVSLSMMDSQHRAPDPNELERLYAYRDWAKMVLSMLKREKSSIDCARKTP